MKLAIKKLKAIDFEEGDFVLINSEYSTPQNGDYVFSVIDNCANLKKFEKIKNRNNRTNF